MKVPLTLEILKIEAQTFAGIESGHCMALLVGKQLVRISSTSLSLTSAKTMNLKD